MLYFIKCHLLSFYLFILIDFKDGISFIWVTGTVKRELWRVDDVYGLLYIFICLVDSGGGTMWLLHIAETKIYDSDTRWRALFVYM